MVPYKTEIIFVEDRTKHGWKGRLLSETVYYGEKVTEDGKPVIPADATTYTYVYGDQYVFGEYKIAKPDEAQ